MFCPLENVPTTRPLLLIATDWSWPAAKPFCVIWPTVALPLVDANCVSAPEAKLSATISDRLTAHGEARNGDASRPRD